jgi:GNAT superfamily N-acetyltransferase
MRDLLVLGAQAQIAASYMHPGVLNWMAYFPPDEEENRRNIRVWEFVGEARTHLAAWALLSRHEGTFDLFVHPALHGTPAHVAVMADYVTWAEERARAVGIQYLSPFWVLDYDTVMVRLLKAHGFVALEGLPPPLFARSLDDLPPVQLPEGFAVQSVQDLHDGRLRAAVTHGAFRAHDDWDAYWAEYAQFIGSAVYEGERDLFVRSPDDRGAAACTIWFDPVNGVGLFEPVATHPDFQRRGLGKAVMAEGMRRMQAAGMRRAILGFDPNNAAARALYTSLGFRAECTFAMYRKDLNND